MISRMILVCCFVATNVCAYDHTMMNLKVLNELRHGEMVINIDHRFLGDMTKDPFDSGANVKMGFRYGLFSKGSELAVNYGSQLKEYSVGFSRVIDFGGKRGLLKNYYVQPYIHFFTFLSDDIRGRQNNFLYLATFQRKKRIKRLLPILNVSYDGYNESFGAGAGFEFQLSLNSYWMGEVYSPNGVGGARPILVTGYKYQTFGHNFMFMVMNTDQVGFRHFIAGASSNEFHFGFTLERLIDMNDIW